jgi:diketogulonate reductase-like aldo/keto reductase
VSIAIRTIPATGEALPVIGLGTWQQFDVGADAADLPRLRQVLQVLLDGGGRVIDASPMYGQAEARVGDLLRAMGRTDDAYLATKVWTRGRAAGLAQMERSRWLMGGRLDLMQVHNLVDLDTHVETIREWQAEGVIRHWGITHYTSRALPELARAIDRHRPDFVQLAYSVGEREAERHVLPLAAQRGVAVLVNRPLEGGGLMRKLRGRPLPDWAAEIGAASWSQLLLRFILAHPSVTCVIPGTDDPAHMADNLAAGTAPLPEPREQTRIAAFCADL